MPHRCAPTPRRRAEPIQRCSVDFAQFLRSKKSKFERRRFESLDLYALFASTSRFDLPFRPRSILARLVSTMP